MNSIIMNAVFQTHYPSKYKYLNHKYIDFIESSDECTF